MADYEKLGIEVETLDTNATTTLSRVVSLLEKISKNTTKATRKKKEETGALQDNNKELKKQDSLLSKAVSKYASVAVVVRKMARFVFGAIKESASYVENLNLFSITFGNSAQEASEWAIKFAYNLGVSNNEIIKTLGLFKQLTSSIGIADKAGTQMSKTLTMLSYDMASFYNIDIESAVSKLQAGIFSGQIRPLRGLGIDVSVEAIDEYVKSLGISNQQMTQSQKVMARMLLTLRGAGNSFGDMSETINTLSNQTRVFQAQLSNFKLAVGDLINEPLRQAMIYINGFLMGLTKIIRAFKPLQKSSNAAANGMSNVVDELKDSNSAAKGTLLEFDKFRTMDSSSSEDSENLAITEALTEELEKQNEKYNYLYASMDNISNKAVEIAEKFKSFFITVDENGNFESITNNGKMVLGIVGAIIGLLVGSGIGNMISGITKGVKALSSAVKGLTSPLGIILAIIGVLYLTNEDFRESMNEFLSEVWSALQPVLESVMDALEALMPIITTLVEILGKTLSINLKMLIPVVKLFGKAFEIVFNILEPVLKVITWLIEKISELRQKIADSAFDKIGESRKGIFSKISIDSGETQVSSPSYTSTNTKSKYSSIWGASSIKSTTTVDSSGIQSSIAQGAYEGTLQALSLSNIGGDSSESININIDGEKVFTAVKNTASRKGLKFSLA